MNWGQTMTILATPPDARVSFCRAAGAWRGDRGPARASSGRGSPLPFRLDHVNIYFLSRTARARAIDTGIDNAASRAAWEALLAGPLAGRRLTRIIATHFHPDHIGLAGWLCERFDLQLRDEPDRISDGAQHPARSVGAQSEPYRSFYRSHGLGEDETESCSATGCNILRMVAPPPRTFLRLSAGIG